MGYYPPYLPNSVVDHLSKIPILQPKIGPVEPVSNIQLKALSTESGAGEDKRKKGYPPLKERYRSLPRGRGSEEKGKHVDCLA